ncbi:hypothetical protein EJB05_32054, partial [Eragrostis curvula]
MSTALQHCRPRVSSAAREDRPSQQGHMSEVADTTVSPLELDKLPE